MLNDDVAILSGKKRKKSSMCFFDIVVWSCFFFFIGNREGVNPQKVFYGICEKVTIKGTISRFRFRC